MRKFAIAALAALFSASSAQADNSVRQNTIAVAGEAEALVPPDYAMIQLGVISQAPLVSDALADNSARMTRVIDAMKALGIPAKDIQTATFVIQPKYEKLPDGDYDAQRFRTIVGYYISNSVTVKVRDLSNVAKIIDDSVKAGANASGDVSFMVDSLAARMDDVRRRAIADALHKAQVLSEAAHMKLGRALSVIDNQANTSYDNEMRGSVLSEEVIVVGGGGVSTPIESGRVTLSAKVTVIYATN